MSEPTELSLEEKLQSTFDQLPELDKNQSISYSISARQKLSL